MTKIIAGNWKMNGGLDQARALTQAISAGASQTPHQLLIFPPAPHLFAVAHHLTGTEIGLGAQDICAHSSGAYTGQISGEMIKETGASYVLVGHSEARQFLHQTNSDLNAKLNQALSSALTPVLCIGESLSEKEDGKTLDVLHTQIKEALDEIDTFNGIIAYEPLWAIGSGRVAQVEDIEAVHKFIRNELGKIYDEETAARIPLLYGGSVKPANAADILNVKHVDGVLVGGASLDAKSFLEIAQ